MDTTLFEIESFQPFSKSLIWQLNRDYYQEEGIEAWSSGEVPHAITSNSLAGKTYAELILGFLQDLSVRGKTKETVYILELGAGHGRLAFHILRHLEKLLQYQHADLPDYCYILSDIAEKNLEFFRDHPQLSSYYESGRLDYAYYDAIGDNGLHLRYADRYIKTKELDQPLLAIANYFFDSLPNDLFQIKENTIKACSIALHSTEPPKETKVNLLLKTLQLSYEKSTAKTPYYVSSIHNEILEHYRKHINDSYLFFPEKSMMCLTNLRSLSTGGLMLLSMDKGFHKLAKIDNQAKPEFITHGSFSVWVNYHALGSYCEKVGGEALFPSNSTFHLQVGCLLFLEEATSYQATHAAYQRYVDDFGPDDFNSIKKLSYANISSFSLMQLLALVRLSLYDSTLFLKVLPRIKTLVKTINYTDRERLAQTMQEIWEMYFNIEERQDLALNIAGVFFDLAYYEQALQFYQYSTEAYGKEADTMYNRLLCHYQLRQDVLFSEALLEAEQLFPKSTLFESLHRLDLEAK